eukprot:1150796-Pelagomonas_calceolata.AAC.4
MSGQERPLPRPPRAAAPSTVAVSLQAAPQVLHQSSPHHAASAGQACASKGQARCHEAAAAAAAAAVRKTALAAAGRAAVMRTPSLRSEEL